MANERTVKRVAVVSCILHTYDKDGKRNGRRVVKPGEVFEASQAEVDSLHLSHPTATRELVNEGATPPRAPSAPPTGAPVEEETI